MSRNLRDLLGNDIIGAVLPIGNIHTVQITKYQWVAYINAEDEPSDDIVDRQVREYCVRTIPRGGLCMTLYGTDKNSILNLERLSEVGG